MWRDQTIQTFDNKKNDLDTHFFCSNIWWIINKDISSHLCVNSSHDGKSECMDAYLGWESKQELHQEGIWRIYIPGIPTKSDTRCYIPPNYKRTR